MINITCTRSGSSLFSFQARKNMRTCTQRVHRGLHVFRHPLTNKCMHARTYGWTRLASHQRSRTYACQHAPRVPFFDACSHAPVPLQRDRRVYTHAHCTAGDDISQSNSDCSHAQGSYRSTYQLSLTNACQHAFTLYLSTLGIVCVSARTMIIEAADACPYTCTLQSMR